MCIESGVFYRGRTDFDPGQVSRCRNYGVAKEKSFVGKNDDYNICIQSI